MIIINIIIIIMYMNAYHCVYDYVNYVPTEVSLIILLKLIQLSFIY